MIFERKRIWKKFEPKKKFKIGKEKPFSKLYLSKPTL